MNKNQIAKKYSRAIISAIDLSEIPKVIGEFKGFSGLLEKNRQLKLLFAGQIFSDEEKDKAFNALAPRMKLSQHAAKFIRLFILQGHLPALREIIIAAINAYNEKQKKATAVVVSPVKLDTRYAERLRNALRTLTQREIELESRVDPSLLGGFIVRVGSTIYDSSLRGQMRLLRAELMR